MNFREGRPSAIKGMVMHMVKRMGICRACGIGGAGERLSTWKGLLLRKGVRKKGCGGGGMEKDIFIQLGCTWAIDMLLQKSPERNILPMEGHLRAFQLFYSPLRQPQPLWAYSIVPPAQMHRWYSAQEKQIKVKQCCQGRVLMASEWWLCLQNCRP